MNEMCSKDNNDLRASDSIKASQRSEKYYALEILCIMYYALEYYALEILTNVTETSSLS